MRRGGSAATVRLRRGHSRVSTFVGTTALEVLQDAEVSAVASLPVISLTGDLVGMISTHHTRPTTWSREMREELTHLSRTAGQLVAR
ncbi:GAF domain-containing protein [Streptomyces sp. NPDC050095]|uniref:GAF domain-containing protein n=1 Tax=unclassified Streptomyces TaxID=2593676 RepID=UPI0034382F1D